MLSILICLFLCIQGHMHFHAMAVSWEKGDECYQVFCLMAEKESSSSENVINHFLNERLKFSMLLRYDLTSAALVLKK